MSERNDTDFWKKFIYENAPLEIQNIINVWKYRLPKYDDNYLKAFGLNSWISVACGLNKINKNSFEELNKYSDVFNDIKLKINKFKDFQNSLTIKCSDHRKFLNNLLIDNSKNKGYNKV